KLLSRSLRRLPRIVCWADGLVAVWHSCLLKRKRQPGSDKAHRLLVHGTISPLSGWQDAIQGHAICARFGKTYARAEIVSAKFPPHVGIIASTLMWIKTKLGRPTASGEVSWKVSMNLIPSSSTSPLKKQKGWTRRSVCS